MNSSIFILRDGDWTEVVPSTFQLERDFQKLIANHPALLSVAAGSDGELLLVSREYGIADEEDGANRWSVDHLFINREGVPVLVEVKRSSDTRARRKVVAQMLDYAAHASKTLNSNLIEERFRLTTEGLGGDPDQLLQDFLTERTVEEFWKQVDANLKAGRLRMVIVVDKVGPELSRIVEFLNEQMTEAAILAVELALFESKDGTRTLVPRLIGATSRADAVKSKTAAGAGGPGLNYSGTVNFAEAKQLCAERGDAVKIGFLGGIEKLRVTSLDNLAARKFKWDNANGSIGAKTPENWLAGTAFLREVQAKT